MIIKFKQIYALIKLDFGMWLKNPRIIATMILTFIICMFVSTPLANFAEINDNEINILEPFLSIFSTDTTVFLIMLGAILLFSDAPFSNQEQPFYIVRTGRRTWIISKILFIIFSSIVYVAFIFIVSAILIFSKAYFGNIWSSNTYQIWMDIENAHDMGIMEINLQAVQYFTPFNAFEATFLLGILYCALMGIVLMTFNLFSKKALGIIIAALIHTFGFALSALYKQGYIPPSNIQYLSLLTNANLASHKFTDIYSLGRPTLQFSYMLFIIIIIVCAIISFFRVKKYSIYFEDNT